jgi:hypothetical protein
VARGLVSLKCQSPLKWLSRARAQPTGELVANGDYKLVFIVHTGQHYLQEVWKSEGKAAATSQIGITIAPADTRTEAPLIRQSGAKIAAAAQRPDRRRHAQAGARFGKLEQPRYH